jgi:hypothetical protein
MTDQELRFMAIQILQQFPAEAVDARRLHALMGELIDMWLYGENEFLTNE